MIEIELRVLFLDDDEMRHDIFSSYHADERVRLHQVRTAKQAITAITELPKFDFIFLDHDLNNEHYNGQGYEFPGTGMDVVDYLCSDRMDMDKRPGAIIIHSWNWYRAVEMEKRLKEAGFPDVRQKEFGAIKYFKLPDKEPNPQK